MRYTKDIFDYRNLPQSVKETIKVDNMPTDPFRDKIYELFSIAKKENIPSLTNSQITVGYYRQYTTKDSKDFKTVEEIQSKLDSIIKSENRYIDKHPDYKLERLKKVDNEKHLYAVE